jgi:hypothetical protein
MTQLLDRSPLRSLWLIAGLALALGLGAGWFLFRTPTATTPPAPERTVSGELPPATSSAMELPAVDREAAPSLTPATVPDPTPTPTANQSQEELIRTARIRLAPLQEQHGSYDRDPNWTSARGVMQSYIVVDMDSKGHHKVYTGGPMFPPNAPGIDHIYCADPRGTRTYSFTREEYPEWFDLHTPPEDDKITGSQDGPAMPTKIAPELAARIRALAVAAIETHHGCEGVYSNP